MINGYAIIVSDDFTVETPRMQLGRAVCEFLAPEQIADHNAWMREFFGVDTRLDNLLADGSIIVMDSQRQFIMNRRTFEMYQKAVIGGNRP